MENLSRGSLFQQRKALCKKNDISRSDRSDESGSEGGVLRWRKSCVQFCLRPPETLRLSRIMKCFSGIRSSKKKK